MKQLGYNNQLGNSCKNHNLVWRRRSLIFCSTFFLLLVTISLSMKAWFRTLASAFRDEATAQAVAGITLIALVLYTGYAIPHPSMIGALRWLTYINVSPS